MSYKPKLFTCKKCRRKLLESFFRDGYNICRGCEKDISYTLGKPVRTCCKCKRILSIKRFISRMRICNDCKKPIDKDASNDARMRMWLSSKSSAAIKGLRHTIKPTDIKIPAKCVYLGILLDYSSPKARKGIKHYNIATIDRIDSSKGYTKDNIQVISWLANRMKTNATEEQLIAFAKGVLKVHLK